MKRHIPSLLETICSKQHRGAIDFDFRICDLKGRGTTIKLVAIGETREDLERYCISEVKKSYQQESKNSEVLVCLTHILWDNNLTTEPVTKLKIIQ